MIVRVLCTVSVSRITATFGSSCLARKIAVPPRNPEASAATRAAIQMPRRGPVDEIVDLMVGGDCCWEFITYLNFVLSQYPDASWTGGVFTDDERKQMLDFSFRHWRQHSPLTKGYLALTLERAGRHDDAVLEYNRVLASYFEESVAASAHPHCIASAGGSGQPSAWLGATKIAAPL